MVLENQCVPVNAIHNPASSADLGILLAYDVAELGLNKGAPITVYSFGGPRVGNLAFKRRCEALGVKVLRVDVNDPVTKLPGLVLNEKFNWSSCYAHVGVEVKLDFFKMRDPSCVHDLETYISLLRSAFPVRRRGEDVMKKILRLNGRKPHCNNNYKDLDNMDQLSKIAVKDVEH
ncbi:hypothetical protein QJS10_CPB18g00455 [Acorus calamus]|uniref:Fungal lipase-type domain-containing protein n=1 Tax=Acorus calamus TaxID=4465 RepID=A0AAV9CL70_ACOCL|nr:hypothetical protein QJS10_CPB18g00455 [Acorus calamus]